MFYYFKKNARNFLLFFVLIFIGGIFLWNYQTKISPDVVLIVDGSKVPYSDFQRILTREIDRKREEGKELNDKEIEQLKQNILSSLVQEQILLKEAKKLHLKVSDELVARVIASLPQFQKDGKFDIRLYYDFLRYYYRATPSEFEEEIRKSILTRTVRRIFYESVKVTEEELLREFKRRNPDKDYEKEREKFKEEFLNEKRNLLYYQWLNSEFQKAKIINNLPRIEKRIQG